MYLIKEVEKVFGNTLTRIPFIVWLLENPQSFLALPGKIDLNNHDCLHILLKQDKSLGEEAFVIGFCMGNDNAKWIHLKIFKIFSRFLYPQNYRFSNDDFSINFAAGYSYGKNLKLKRINRLHLTKFYDTDVTDIRYFLEINEGELDLINLGIKQERAKNHYSNNTNLTKLANILRWSSSLFAVGGGFLLALNLKISAYGFIFLACSSFQLLISSIIHKDKSLFIYAVSVFTCTDMLGVYRWLLK
jgi:hypothetical protein